MEKCYFCSRKKDVAEIIGKTRNDGACKMAMAGAWDSMEGRWGVSRHADGSIA